MLVILLRDDTKPSRSVQIQSRLTSRRRRMFDLAFRPKDWRCVFKAVGNIYFKPIQEATALYEFLFAKGGEALVFLHSRLIHLLRKVVVSISRPV